MASLDHVVWLDPFTVGFESVKTSFRDTLAAFLFDRYMLLCTKRSNKSYKPWFTHELEKQLKKCKNLYNQSRLSDNDNMAISG
ncbi:hypothetical protein GJ496_003048 [Pomphorhynchus laevis]|nr:hypothetical protein GJ496_003048 [Pomphorhynchus laevis]